MSEKVLVEKREVFGRKLKPLRKQEILPANIYGKAFKSQAVQLKLKDFIDLYKKAGETTIVNLSLGKEEIPALIHNVQVHPLTHTPIHVDFLKVNLKEKITTHIPLEFTGEPMAVSDSKGILNTPLTSVEVEALPGDLPEKIEVNLENLAEVGDHITVNDLKIPSGVTITSEPSDVVATISELREEEPEPEPEPEETPEGEEEKEEQPEEEADSESETQEEEKQS